ncbi:MAG: hypothetical protein Q9223_001080 [Gallowayella weberi]
MPGPISAIVGKPPLTADDTLIVHGFQVLLGMGKKDPSLGLTIAKKAPPPGQPHESDTTAIAVGCAISMTLMTIFTGTRLYIRATNRGLVWGWDDWAVIVATLFAMSIPIIYCYKLVNAGGGKHVYDVTYWELANHQSMSTPSFALFYVAVASIKISILFFYMRLTAFASRTWLWIHRSFILVLVICALVSLLVTVFQCDPSIYSNIREVGRRNVKLQCLPLINLTVGFNVWHIVSDALLLVVPFLMLWRVQMKWTTKCKVCIAGVIGFCNVGLAIGRTVAQATARQQPGFDLTYTATMTFTYSATELTLGIFTANLPVLSIVATKAVEMLSWHSVSSGDAASPNRSGNNKSSGGAISRFYKRKMHDASETEFGGLKDGGRPTRRCDVEYGSREGLYVK